MGTQPDTESRPVVGGTRPGLTTTSVHAYFVAEWASEPIVEAEDPGFTDGRRHAIIVGDHGRGRFFPADAAGPWTLIVHSPPVRLKA